MIIIGLTGSIGTGKSTVARLFARLGASTFDSDAAVHALLASGGEAVGPVAAAFPGTLEWGGINRTLLGAEVFGNPAKLKRLENILHPLVREAQDRFLRKARLRRKRLAVLDIPLLFETGGEARCDATVVTSAPAFLQKKRVCARAGMTPGKFARIVKAQMPDREKRRRADFVVPTGLGKAWSMRAVRRILAKLKV